MRSDKLQDAIGMVDEELIVAADKKPNILFKFRWVAVVAAMLVIAIGIGVVTLPDVPMTGEVDNTTATTTRGTTSGTVQTTTQSTTQTTTQSTTIKVELPTALSSHAISEAVYPTMAKYPQVDGYNYDSEKYELWQADRKKQSAYKNAVGNLDEFYKKTIPEFLIDNKNENRVYSPLNMYMALSMLAEINNNKGRDKLLDFLQVDSIQSLRTQAHGIWNANYCDDGAVTSILGSSLWLRDGVSYNKEVINNLTKYYYASSYSGKMGSTEYNNMLKNWLNKQTGGLLQDQVEDTELSEETIMALLTTVYFTAKWDKVFYDDRITQKLFHTPSGDEFCEFMHETNNTGRIYWGEKFSSTTKGLKEGGEVVFILPDENVSVNELLKDEETLSFISSKDTWDNQKGITVNLSVPKFDIQSNYDIIKGMKNLGLADCLGMVSSASHSSRVVADKEGVVATSFIPIYFPLSAPPLKDKIDFVLDRPFIFVINSSVGMPLFVGVVNNP
ncbi:MAG: hypothetical protein IJF54_04725 [Clostridia bacterium]|nr:hypothetical protein [Clostridia bacterium]